MAEAEALADAAAVAEPPATDAAADAAAALADAADLTAAAAAAMLPLVAAAAAALAALAELEAAEAAALAPVHEKERDTSDYRLCNPARAAKVDSQVHEQAYYSHIHRSRAGPAHNQLIV